MKKLMILGAGVYQVPLIKQAKKMGIYTIVVSIKGKYPGFSLADKVYYEDITNYKKILEIAKAEKIDGIMTAGTDVAVITIGYVCDKLHLKGLSMKSAERATNKMLMKNQFEKNGVRTARFREVAFNLNTLIKETSELTFPLIFKAVDTSGSRGIKKVNSISEFEDAMNYVKKATKLDYFIVEEFIVGEEFGAQAFVQDGEIQFILPHGDYVFTGETGVPIGHFAPYNLNHEIIVDTKKQLERAIKALELDNCAINADFILHNGKTYVLEIGGRSGATCLAELTSIYYNFNYYEKMIQVALGESVDFSSTYSIPNASKLLLSKKSGKLEEQYILNSIDSNGVELQFDYNIGDNINSFKVGPDRIGHVITKGKTLDQAYQLLEETIKNIYIKVN